MGGSRIDITLLIDLVREEPHIYDKANRFFKDDLVKQRSFDKIGEILHITGEQCRKLWKNLRDRYVREKKKVVTHSGQEYDDEDTWQYMKNMRFLAPHIKPRSTYSATAAKMLSCSGSVASTSSANTENSPFESTQDGLLNEIDNDLLSPSEPLSYTEDSLEEESKTPSVLNIDCSTPLKVHCRTPTPTTSMKATSRGLKENKNKVANDLLQVARDIVTKIQPDQGSQKPNTDNAFGQYVAQRLQEMDPEERSAKRRAIVSLLEDS